MMLKFRIFNSNPNISLINEEVGLKSLHDKKAVNAFCFYKINKTYLLNIKSKTKGIESKLKKDNVSPKNFLTPFSENNSNILLELEPVIHKKYLSVQM
jgi:hypothetical protein